MIENTHDSLYKVLNPFAEADQIPLHGISPRLSDLDGKIIGLFANNKRAGVPILKSVEEVLSQNYPTAQFKWYEARESLDSITNPDIKRQFEEWLSGVDGIVAAVGD